MFVNFNEKQTSSFKKVSPPKSKEGTGYIIFNENEKNIIPSSSPSPEPSPTPTPSPSPPTTCWQYTLYNPGPLAIEFSYTDCNGDSVIVNIDADSTLIYCSNQYDPSTIGPCTL